MQRITNRRLATALTTIIALTSIWSSDGWAQDEIPISGEYILGPHAEGGETLHNPNNEWLSFSAEGSPTNRTDGGLITFNFCKTHYKNRKNNLKLYVKTPQGRALITDDNRVDCEGSFYVPFQEAKYEIEIKGHGIGTSIDSTVKLIAPYSSMWIVILGDSYSSGEGAPESKTSSHASWRRGETRRIEIPSTNEIIKIALRNITSGDNPIDSIGEAVKEILDIEDRQCNRSSKSWAFQAGLKIQDLWKIPADITLHACSGAAIKNISPNNVGNSEQLFGYSSKIATQLEVLRSQIEKRKRTPDIVLMSAGGNDAGFGSLVQNCYKQKLATKIINDYIYLDLPDIPCTFIEQNTGDLPPLYDNLSQSLKDLDIERSRTFISTYPLPDYTNHKELENCLMTKLDMTFATLGVAQPLNTQVKNAATLHGWHSIENDYALLAHGYCSNEPWINGLDNSLYNQGDQYGTFHPTSKGYDSMSTNAVNKLKNATTKGLKLQSAIEIEIDERAENALKDSKKISAKKINTDGSISIYNLDTEGQPTSIVGNDISLNLENLSTGDPRIRYDIIVNGKPYMPGDKLSIPGPKPVFKHKIELIRSKLPNINTYKRLALNGTVPITLGKTTHEIIQIDPERLDAQVQMHIRDPNTDHRTQILLSELLDSKSKSYRPAGGYIENAEVQYTVTNSELEIQTIRHCGNNVTAVGKPITTMINEPRYLAQDYITETITQNKFSALDGSCWNAPDDLMHGPESVLLQPVINFGNESISTLTQLHLGIGQDKQDWQTTVDIAVGGFSSGSTLGTSKATLTCDASWKDLRQGDANTYLNPHAKTPLIALPLNSLGISFWYTPLPYYPAGDSRVAYTGNLAGYVCTNSKNEPVTLSSTGAPEMDPAIDTYIPQNLEVWAVPEPVWSGYGDTGTFIYGTHIEINGRAVTNTTPNGPGSLNTDLERIVSSFYKNDKAVKYRGRATISGEFDNRLTVYACINAQAKCSPNTKVADEPSEVQQYGYVKVLDIPLTRENMGTN